MLMKFFVLEVTGILTRCSTMNDKIIGVLTVTHQVKIQPWHSQIFHYNIKLILNILWTSAVDATHNVIEHPA